MTGCEVTLAQGSVTTGQVEEEAVPRPAVMGPVAVRTQSHPRPMASVKCVLMVQNMRGWSSQRCLHRSPVALTGDRSMSGDVSVVGLERSEAVTPCLT